MGLFRAYSGWCVRHDETPQICKLRNAVQTNTRRHTHTHTHAHARTCTKRDPLQLGHLVDMQPLFLSQVGALDHDTALLRALSEGEGAIGAMMPLKKAPLYQMS